MKASLSQSDGGVKSEARHLPGLSLFVLRNLDEDARIGDERERERGQHASH